MYHCVQTAHADWKLDTGSDGGALLVEEKQVVVGTSDGRGTS